MVDENNDPIEHIDEKPSDPYGIEASDIDSGVRKTLNTCQYWVKGLSGICKYWEPGDPGNCTYDFFDANKNRKTYPSGWNNSRCDFLGRQYSCDKYELGGSENLDQYICIAPLAERSGLYISEDDAGIYKRAIRMSEVKGYNADSNFVGQCDGCGLGKGLAGYNVGSCTGELFEDLPVICNYYRPWQMGFGAKVPKTTDITSAKKDRYGRLIGDERDYFDDRLPLSFKVYNLRAKLQKCAYWDRDEGSEFILDEAGLYLWFDENDKSDFCINTGPNVTPYHTESSNPPPSDMLLENVWSEADCVVCNGARENCPGYTGRWIYCTDDRLEKGDKVSAQQILELRFWMNNWSSLEEYDSVFKRPPNKSDPSTSSIYTYGRWQTLCSNPIDSILLGKKASLCVPNARNEFSTDLVQVREFTFIKKSTTAPEEPDQVTFPSLVRDIEGLGIPPLYIIYPYHTKDPFNTQLNPICGESFDPTPCVKRHYSVDGNSVSVVGYTTRNKTIYAFNATKTGYKGFNMLRDNYSLLSMESTRDRVAFNETMEGFIKDLDEDYENLLFSSISNSDGFFSVGPIDLEYQKINELVVCFKYNNDWIFRKRNVWAQWHAGAIIQTKFNHEYESGTAYVDDGYSIFTPPASAEGSLIPLKGNNSYGLSTNVNDLIKAVKTTVYRTAVDFHCNFSYCIKKVTKTDQEIDRWLRADSAGSLWIEIEDLNLNYIFSWWVSEGTLYKEDADGNITESITMSAVFPSSSNVRESIAPNCCIIEPKDGIKRGIFGVDNWKLKIDYWYYILDDDDSTTPEEENTTIEIIYPDFSLDINRFASANYALTWEGENFAVSNITKDTVGLMAFFEDEDGRIASTFATKICVDIARVFSRDVEIKYAWRGNYVTYQVMPQSGFLRAKEDGPFIAINTGTTQIGSLPPCGDHETGFFSGIGPLWFPYDACEIIDFYDVWTGANSIVAPHEETPRRDYRYQGPVENIPFCEPHATLWDCAEDWGCGYHKLDTRTIRFTGWAKRRGYINTTLYKAMGWDVPRFGNVLREYVERYRSLDNNYHISYKERLPSASYAWMPLVVDNSAFYIGFNCFDGADLVYVNPLNFWLIADEIVEKEESDHSRYRFEDLFGIRRTILASYPLPVIEQSGLSYPFVVCYYFKEDTTQWAWQEKWKDIERNLDGAGKLGLVLLERPEYVFDRFKEEHRLIVEEGEYDLVFTAPEFDPETGEIIKWPSMRIGAGYARWFKILENKNTPYEDYDETLVDWSDENSGAVDGSGGSTQGNIYEKTTISGEWIHAHADIYTDLNNMIYDSQATNSPNTAENAGRKIEASYDSVLGEAEEYVYNRGLIAKIYKRRLMYLPYEEAVVEINEGDISYDPPRLEGDEAREFPSAALASWADKTYIDIDFDFGQETHCVSKVIVTGYTGNVLASGIKYNLNQPTIDLYERADDTWPSETASLATREGISMTITERNSSGIGVTLWEKEIEIDISPTRMITHRAKGFRVGLTNAGFSGASVSIKSVELYEASYKSHTEKIKVWERKYNRSVGEVGDFNLDGSNRVLSHEHNEDNSGIYYNEYIDANSSRAAFNKMRRVYGRESHEDEEEILISSSPVEAEIEQNTLYLSAYTAETVGNRTNYKSVTPPTLDNLNLKENSNLPSLTGRTIVLTSYKRAWDNHPYSGGYELYELWQPKGHFYRWAEETRKARCYIVSPEVDVMQLELSDVYHNQIEYASSALESRFLRAYHAVAQTAKTHGNTDIGFIAPVDLITGGGDRS